MKPSSVRRLFGLLSGTALMGIGAAEIAIDRSNYENPAVQPFCRAGFCADQFSLERIFEIAQKASLGDARGELEDFRRAIRLSPASAYRWADLSEAEFNVRDYAQAEYALSRAVKAGPRSPVILMRAANLEFQIGNAPEVIPYLSAILSDPDLVDFYDAAFFTYSRLGLPINEILSSGVPAKKEAMSRLLTFWGKANRVDEAVATWKYANQRGLADTDSTGAFFSFLIKANQSVLAQQLWLSYVDKNEPGYRKSNYVYNPGFEAVPLNSPFDWTIKTQKDVEAERVQNPSYDGRWCLRLRFSGETNADYQQTYQDVVLEPGRYQFSAMLKSDNITTDQGVRVHIFDWPTQAHLNVWTDTSIGTENWKKLENSFDVPVGIKVVRVQIDRQPSIRFDNKIGGTAWIDHIRLSRQ